MPMHLIFNSKKRILRIFAPKKNLFAARRPGWHSLPPLYPRKVFNCQNVSKCMPRSSNFTQCLSGSNCRKVLQDTDKKLFLCAFHMRILSLYLIEFIMHFPLYNFKSFPKSLIKLENRRIRNISLCTLNALNRVCLSQTNKHCRSASLPPVQKKTNKNRSIQLSRLRINKICILCCLYFDVKCDKNKSPTDNSQFVN